MSPAEVRTCNQSLLEMSTVLGDEEMLDDAGVAIEYRLPPRCRRMHFVTTGEGEDARGKAPGASESPRHLALRLARGAGCIAHGSGSSVDSGWPAVGTRRTGLRRLVDADARFAGRPMLVDTDCGGTAR